MIPRSSLLGARILSESWALPRRSRAPWIYSWFGSQSNARTTLETGEMRVTYSRAGLVNESLARRGRAPLGVSTVTDNAWAHALAGPGPRT